jgi:hypothetical protein
MGFFWYQHLFYDNPVLMAMTVCIPVLNNYLQDSGTSISVLDFHLNFWVDDDESQNLGTWVLSRNVFSCGLMGQNLHITHMWTHGPKSPYHTHVELHLKENNPS